MSYMAKTRSNYFHVKDPAAFEQFCHQLELKLIHSGDKLGFVVDSIEGGIAMISCDEETGEPVDIDFMELLAEHLVEGQVAVVIEIGSDKMRSLTGRALAVNSQCMQRMVDLIQIYDLARTLGEMVTAAEL